MPPTAPAPLNQAQLDAQNASLGRTQFNTGPATVGTSINQPPVIPVSGLSTSASPISLPSSVTTANSATLPSVESLLGQANVPTAAEQKDSTDISTITNQIEAALAKQGTQADETANLNESEGVNTLNGQINELNKQILGVNDSANKATNISEDRQAPSFAITGEQAQIARQKAVQMYSLSAASAALTGDLSLAQDRVKTALSKEFDPIASQIASYQVLLQNAKSNMSDDQKKEADLITGQLAERTRILDQQQKDKTSIYNVMLEAAKNKAPNTTLNAILNAATPADAIRAAGNSLVTPTTPTTTQTINNALAAFTNAFVAGAKMADGSPTVDVNGFITPAAWKAAIASAPAEGISRADFITNFGGKLYAPGGVVDASYGLTPSEAKIITGTAGPGQAAAGGSGVFNSALSALGKFAGF